MITIKSNPEFASELVCVIPYVYWLHEQGKLKKVITSKGMKPFYYFCDDVEEHYDKRTLDNSHSGLSEVPNDWIHHNAMSVFGKGYDTLTIEEQEQVNGVLDYSQWTPPPYSEYYKTSQFDNLKPYVVINNNYNIEYGMDMSKSRRYFDIKALYDMFNYFTEKGYTVIYKRPDNTEFTLDDNEVKTLHNNFSLSANVDGIGNISDYDLCTYYNGKVINLNELKSSYPNYSYNELQLRLFSNSDGFITTNGGGGMLCACFGKPVIVYVPHGKELRKNYLTNKKSYCKKLSNCDVHTVVDTGKINNYNKVIDKIKEIFK